MKSSRCPADRAALMCNQMVPLSETWSDYDGHAIYGDFALDGSDVTVLRSFEPGLAWVENPFDPPNQSTGYYHGDHLGTTRGHTSPGGTWLHPSTYTAFGERIDGTMAGPFDRYGYVGSSGYQGHPEFPYMHVGWRYYDPGMGRFLQRDPIGTGGGLNVYEYTKNTPLATSDPNGADPCPFCGHDPDMDGISISCGPVSVPWSWLDRKGRRFARWFREGYYHGWFDRYIRSPIDKAVDKAVDTIFPPAAEPEEPSYDVPPSLNDASRDSGIWV